MLVRQLASPVRWTATVQALTAAGASRCWSSAARARCSPRLTGASSVAGSTAAMRHRRCRAALQAALSAGSGDIVSDGSLRRCGRWSPAHRAASARRSPQRWPREGATVIGTATSDAGRRGHHRPGSRSAAQGARHALRRAGSAKAPSALVADLEGHEGIAHHPRQQCRHHPRQAVLRMKDEDWDAIIDTNLTSVFRLSHAVLRA